MYHVVSVPYQKAIVFYSSGGKSKDRKRRQKTKWVWRTRMRRVLKEDAPHAKLP